MDTPGPKNPNRIPFEQIEGAQHWRIPSFGPNGKVVPSAQREAQKGKGERVETVDGAQVKPITAERLQQITEAAEREGREHGYREGFQQGFEEGEKQGLAQGEKQAYAETQPRLLAETQRFEILANALYEPTRMQEVLLENWVLDMAVQLAQHLIHKELNEDPAALFALVRQAIASLPAGANHIRVYLNPDDVEPAHEAFAALGKPWQCLPDASLKRGGCRVESNESWVDYSVEKRLAAYFEAALLKDREGEDTPTSLPAPIDYAAQFAALEKSAPPISDLDAEDDHEDDLDAQA